MVPVFLMQVNVQIVVILSLYQVLTVKMIATLMGPDTLYLTGMVVVWQHT